MSDNQFRACVDCKWFSRSDFGDTCTKHEYKKFNPVHGWEEPGVYETRAARDGVCGLLGRGWEAREPLPSCRLCGIISWTIILGGLACYAWYLKGLFL